MPLSPTYPGVYIEEVPSSVRTIAGVATSITAFVGRALRGPIDVPLRISSWGDFERKYGGLWKHSTMSYAVQQYYLNGGTDAVIVRLVDDDGDAATEAANAATVGGATGDEVWIFRAPDSVPDGRLEITITHPAADSNMFTLRVDNTDTLAFEETLVDPSTLTDGDTIGTTVPVVLVTPDGVPPIRPDEVTNAPLVGGTAAAVASASIDGSVFQAATAGSLGERLVATVLAVADPTHYSLRIELQDDDGDVLAGLTFVDITPSTDWGTSIADRIGTTDTLIDISGPSPARPSTLGSTVGDSLIEPFGGGIDVNTPRIEVGVTVVVETLPLVAANPGEWGNNLRASVDHDTEPAGLFNLRIDEIDPSNPGNPAATETFRNVSGQTDHPRFIKTILDEQSSLVRLVGDGPWDRPPVSSNLEFRSGRDGGVLVTSDYMGSPDAKTGVHMLEKADLFNLLVIPPPTQGSDTHASVWIEAMAYCKKRRAMLLVDGSVNWKTKDQVLTIDPALQGADAVNAAMYWPHIKVADPLQEYRLAEFPPSGAVAGIMARTDAQQGVWKAPAGTESTATGARGLSASLTNLEHGQINPLGINVLRSFPVYGTVVWGARTLRGSDQVASEWKYVPVRRLALMIEESLYRGTQWAVFQGNDEPLWAQLRMNIKAFMHDLFRQGAFQGSSPRDAYLVKCDSETTTQNDIDRGIVNVVVGFRPLKPAEFVILKISQLAGQVGA